MTVPCLVAGNGGISSVLVVEDDAVIRALYRAILAPRGHAITEVEEGERALDAALDMRPDVILLDIGLPGIDGLEVLRLLKANDDVARIPVVMITAWDEPETVHEALQGGASAFIPKPFDPDDLTDRLDAILADGVHGL